MSGELTKRPLNRFLIYVKYSERHNELYVALGKLSGKDLHLLTLSEEGVSVRRVSSLEIDQISRR